GMSISRRRCTKASEDTSNSWATSYTRIRLTSSLIGPADRGASRLRRAATLRERLRQLARPTRQISVDYANCGNGAPADGGAQFNPRELNVRRHPASLKQRH